MKWTLSQGWRLCIQIEMKWNVCPMQIKGKCMYYRYWIDVAQSTFIFYQNGCWSMCFKCIIWDCKQYNTSWAHSISFRNANRMLRQMISIHKVLCDVCVQYLFVQPQKSIHCFSSIFHHFESNSQSCLHLPVNATFFDSIRSLKCIMSNEINECSLFTSSSSHSSFVDFSNSGACYAIFDLLK